MSIKIAPDPLANAFPVPDGDLALDVVAWSDLLLDPAAPFDRAKHDEPAVFSLQTPTASPATFAATNTIKLTLGGSFASKIALDVAWKDGAASEELQRLQEDGWLPPAPPEDGELHLVCLMTAEARLNGGAQLPVGGAGQAALGLTVGGDVELVRVKRYDRTLPARDILSDFFGSFRSPLQAPRAALAAGEVITFAYRGDLKFTASLSAGYEVAGFKGFTVGSLAPRLQYHLAAQASANVSFNAAGAFRYTLGPGARANSVRLRLTKENAVGRQFGFGLVIGGELKTDGLPENTEKLFDALLGLDVGSALGWLQTVADSPSFESAAATLKEKFGDYATDQLRDLAKPVLDRVFDSGAYQEFRTAAQRITAAPAELRDRAVELLGRFEGERKQAIGLLKTLTTLTPDSLRTLADNEAWDYVIDFFGDELLSKLTSRDEFATLTSGAEKLLALLETDVGGQLETLWTELTARTGLTKLAEVLATAANPEAARAAIDARLETLLKHGFDLTLGQLASTPAGTAAFNTAQSVAKRILSVRKTLDAALKAAREQKSSASIGLEFGRTSESSVLLDLEFDLAHANAELTAALAGDFEPALVATNKASHVRLLGGRLRQMTASTRRVSVAAFGWSRTTMSELKQLTETVIHPGGDGTVYLITSDVSFDRSSVTKSKRQIEEVKTRFVLRSVASATEDDRRGRNFLRPLLQGMTVTYAVAQSDTDTTWEELDDYLRFADELDLIPNPSPQRRTEFLDELRGQFPNGPGKVSIGYTVKYPEDALLRALNTLENAERDATARKAIRSYFAARYRTKQPAAWARTLIESYVQAMRVVKAPSLSGPRSPGAIVKADVDFADGTSKRIGQGGMILLSWWNEETRFLKALDDLATIVVSPADADTERLDQFTKRFVGVAEGKPIFGSELWTENVFFLAVDALLTHPKVPNAARQALLTLRLQPPGAATPTTRLLPSANVAVA